jgi:hypothetical protein
LGGLLLYRNGRAPERRVEGHGTCGKGCQLRHVFGRASYAAGQLCECAPAGTGQGARPWQGRSWDARFFGPPRARQRERTDEHKAP